MFAWRYEVATLWLRAALVTMLIAVISSDAWGAELSFTDITLSAGTGGPTESRQTGGHGAMFADVDNDGRPDLYITMIFDNPMADLFFRNQGGNRFAEQGRQRGIADYDGGSHGACFADLDNDGDFDLVNGTTWHHPRYPSINNIFRNDGTGRFTDLTPISGIPRDRTWPTRAVLTFDMDNDGDLDLFCVTNAYGSKDPPDERNEVYRNDGNMKFAPINSGALFTAPCGQGATDSDYDGDGDVDVIAANRTGDVNILRNDGHGNFTRIPPASIGIRHRAGDGITMADVDNDGDLDMLLASDNVGHLYLHSGHGTFEFKQSFSNTDGYMGGFADLDNDGDVDLVFAGDDVCYLNGGRGHFTIGPPVPVSGINDPRGIAFADIDGDGDVDFAIGCKRSRNWLVRNNFNSGNWLKVRLISPSGQAGAFGAKTRVYPAGQAGEKLLGFRESRSNNGYLGQNDPVLHFGLGSRESVDVVVTFLDGTTVRGINVSANQTITINGSQSPVEPSGHRSREVPLWGRFETQIINERGYSNPFRDVVLNAVFTSPTGRSVKFSGYYDGDGSGGQNGNVWKLRFMPDELGTWSYRCSFSDGMPGKSGVFTCVADGGRPGPLRADRRCLKFVNGKRLYPRGYYFSEAFTATSPHWQKGIETSFGGTHNYNLCCTTFWQGRLLENKGWNALPYNGFYPIYGRDYTRLDVAAWRHVDEVLQRLESREVIWYNFDGFVPNVGANMGSQRVAFEAQKAYVRNVVARLAPYWNIVWNIAFEWHEFMSPAEVKRLADYVRSLDPWNHLIGVHDQGPYSSGTQMASNLHVDFATLQYSAGTCGDALTASKFVQKFANDWPIYAQEVCWEGLNKLTADQVRKGAWGVVLGGGILNYAEQFDQVYGNGKCFPYLEIVFDFIESIPYYQMQPHNELVNSACICFAKLGERYVCYSQNGELIRLDLTSAAGEYEAEWLNPRSGEKHSVDAVEGGAKCSFACPDKNDWVLHLRRKER